MDLSTISEVREMSDSGRVNQLLAEGWVLLAAASGVTRESQEDTPWTKYTLGLPGRPPFGS